MKVQVLQHVPFEGLGSMEPWLLERKAQIGYTRLYEEAILPAAGSFDLLIVLGGPMSVNDESQYPWLETEKAFIKAAIGGGVPVLGICLGAQLIASGMGARVYPNAEKEIGWFPIEATPAGAEQFAFPARLDVFHWHGETFDLPPGAVRLARSAACENQAFQLGAKVMGLQFHLETTPHSADAIISHCRHELVVDTYVQTEAQLRAAPADAYGRINALMGEVLRYLLD